MLSAARIVCTISADSYSGLRVLQVRSVLHPTLQHYSSKQLLEMFSWEFQRLPLIHNAPVDDWDVDRGSIEDDSPMDITLSNGYIQQPCQRSQNTRADA